MVLDGLSRGFQEDGDFVVRLAGENVTNDVPFAGRQVHVTGLPVPDLLGGERSPSRGDGADRGEEFLEWGGLQEEPIRPKAQSCGDVLAGPERREDQDRWSPPPRYVLEQLEPVPVRKPDVEEQDINIVSSRNCPGFCESRSIGNDFDVPDGCERGIETREDDRVVVDQRDTNHFRQATATLVPARVPAISSSAPIA
ncbi:MAG TPA: hypothetical protein VJ850_08340 [Candidatus Limnocylindrales bacterium]|nr:hypothetical protein [Candidatus Limnocylindrales bacterium]